MFVDVHACSFFHFHPPLPEKCSFVFSVPKTDHYGSFPAHFGEESDAPPYLVDGGFPRPLLSKRAAHVGKVYVVTAPCRASRPSDRCLLSGSPLTGTSFLLECSSESSPLPCGRVLLRSFSMFWLFSLLDLSHHFHYLGLLLFAHIGSLRRHLSSIAWRPLAHH